MPRSAPVKKASASTSSPVARAPKDSTPPVAYVPTGEAMALFKAVELGAKGAEKLAEWLRSEGPVVVQILDAQVQDDSYVVQFRATNQTVHGLYILGAALRWPQAIPDLPLSLKPARRIGLGEDPPAALHPYPLPKHLGPAQSFEFFTVIPLPSPEHLDAGLWHRRIGKAMLKFQMLNKASADSRAIDFAILLSAKP